MVPPSLAIMGEEKMAIADLINTHKFLALPNGLMRHILNAAVEEKDSYCKTDLWIDGTAWGRANGWWLAGVVDTLEVMKDRPKGLLQRFRRTCASLLALQDGGFWRV